MVSRSGQIAAEDNNDYPAFYAYARKGELAWVDPDPGPGTHGGHWLLDVEFEEIGDDGIKATNPDFTVWLYDWAALDGLETEVVNDLRKFHAKATEKEHKRQRQAARPWS